MIHGGCIAWAKGPNQISQSHLGTGSQISPSPILVIDPSIAGLCMYIYCRSYESYQFVSGRFLHVNTPCDHHTNQEGRIIPALPPEGSHRPFPQSILLSPQSKHNSDFYHQVITFAHSQSSKLNHLVWTQLFLAFFTHNHARFIFHLYCCVSLWFVLFIAVLCSIV